MTEPSHLLEGAFWPGAGGIIAVPGQADGWDRLGDAAGRLASALRAMRVRPGDRVGWIGPNDPRQLLLLAACSRLGAIQVPLNWRLSAEELRWIEADAGFRCLAADAGFSHPYLDDARRRGTEIAVFDPTKPPAPCGSGDTGPDQPATAPLLLCYTSGTTGRPKGVVLTQAAMLAHVRMATTLFGMSKQDRVMTVLPLFHVGGLCIQTIPALLAGAALVLHARFDAAEVFDSLAQHRPTLTVLVPTIMRALVEHPRWAAADLSCLRAIGAGSSEVPLDLIEAFHRRGVPVQQVYGLTESGPIAIAQTPEEALAVPETIGRPVGPCEARIAHPEGGIAAAGEAGEVELRSPALFTGYWRDPAATEAAFTGDGWFRTGDLGQRDAAGRFRFVDRLKHVIISGGENISPAEVERVLMTAPGVLDCAVCGRPDARWGAVPVAYVVPGPGFDQDAVLRHCDGRLARFKQPREIIAVAALPRTALGKVQRAELHRLAQRWNRGGTADAPSG
jgi:fatty-acyl-CoA synthase